MLMSTSASYPPIHHVSVAGSALERGVRIGQLTQSKVAYSLDTYERLFALCDITWAQAVQQGLGYLDALSALSPNYLEELQGIAQGASVDFESLLALNCRTEILPSNFLSKALLLSDKPHVVEKASQLCPNATVNECTSFAVAGAEQNFWLAQNWDWCGLQRNAMSVIESHIHDGLCHLTVTESGMLAKIGMNSHGLAITLNILRSDKDGAAEGVPVHFLLRSLLDCESVEHCIDLVTAMKFSSSSNVMVLDANGQIASFELSPYGVKVLNASEDGLCHTNHFLHDALESHDVGRPGNESTINRLNRANASVHPQMSKADIVDLLSDQSDGLESICRFGDPTFPPIAQIETVTAVIMNTADKTLSVSAAQPSLSEFVTYSI